MTVYEAPAKVNLSLLVSPPRSDGYHPLQSLVQTVDWCDRLEVSPAREGTDTLDSVIDDNLVTRALGELRKQTRVPPLAMVLGKEIPIAAGLGGGSSDAAAALVAGAEAARYPRTSLPEVAARVGADVTLFLTGGTQSMTGVGHDLETVSALEGFALAVVVPHFGLETKEVYERWDVLGGPEGRPIPDDRVPPGLRGGMPLRNDLLPAALDLEPRLGDFMADVSSVWGAPVALTGSGSACFGYFATTDEAQDAATAVAVLVSRGRGVGLRDRGVDRVDDLLDD